MWGKYLLPEKYQESIQIRSVERIAGSGNLNKVFCSGAVVPVEVRLETILLEPAIPDI